jgi:nucleotide-binding universal stress UspA family protein
MDEFLMEPQTGLLTWINTAVNQVHKLQLSSPIQGPAYSKGHLMYRKIMVATDGTPLSKKAVVAAIGMAQLCDAELTAVKVVPRYIQSYFEGSVPLGANEVKRIEAQWSQDAQKILDAVGKMAAAKGVKLKTVVLKSDQVADALVAAANKAKTDLIVMASHGRSGIKRLLLGSETQHVLTHGKTPVLVLR